MNQTQIIYLLLVLSIKQHWIVFLFVIIATDLKQKVLSANSTQTLAISVSVSGLLQMYNLGYCLEFEDKILILKKLWLALVHH